jgi:hypothetical protein
VELLSFLLSAKGTTPSPYLSLYAVLNKLGLSGYDGEGRHYPSLYPRHNSPDPVYSTQQAMVKEIELKVWVYNLMLGLALVPALSAAGS